MIFIKNHWVSVIEFGAVALVAVAVMMGARAYGRYRSEAAAGALYDIEKLSLEPTARVEKLSDVASRYSRYFAGKKAMMDLGEGYMAEGKNAEAEEQFLKLADGSRNQPMLRIAALHKIAEIKLAAGDAAGAAAIYRKAAADPSNLIPRASELLAAACLERAGDYKAAADLYKIIIEDAREDEKGVKAVSEERLLWLAANGHI